MNESDVLRVTHLAFQGLLLLSGLVFAFMGYRLIVNGFSSPKSTVALKWGEKSLHMTQLTPGAFLAFLGAAIIVAGFVTIHPQRTVVSPQMPQTEPASATPENANPFGQGGPVAIKDITDGTSTTILMGETLEKTKPAEKAPPTP